MITVNWPAKEGRDVQKKALILHLLMALAIGASSCTFLGLSGPQEPQQVTLIFSGDTGSELMPCG